MTRNLGMALAGVATCSALLVACSLTSGIGSTSGVAADMVFTNAKVYTVNPSQPWAEAVAIAGGKIVYVGDADAVSAFIGDDTEVFDVEGKMVLPGFVSGHDHLIASQWTAYGASLYAGRSKEEYHRFHHSRRLAQHQGARGGGHHAGYPGPRAGRDVLGAR